MDSQQTSKKNTCGSRGPPSRNKVQNENLRFKNFCCGHTYDFSSLGNLENDTYVEQFYNFYGCHLEFKF